MMDKVIANFPQPELVRVIRLSAGLDTLRPRSWIAVLRLIIAVLRSHA